MNSDLIEKINKFSSYDCADRSYSPLFSEIGLEIKEGEKGVGPLHFHYNRASRPVFDISLKNSLSVSKEKSTLTQIVFGENEAKLSFYDRNCFEYYQSGNGEIFLFDCPSEGTTGLWTENDAGSILIRGYTKNNDGRDPDEKAPFIIGIRIIKGKMESDNPVCIKSENGEILVAVSFEGGECSRETTAQKLAMAPDDIGKSAENCQKWFEENTADFNADIHDDKINSMLAEGIKALLFNATIGCGRLKKYVSAYPSRGGYPCHFIWDTYFQNLGYEKLNHNLCRDFLLQIVEQSREDGKFPQFMCSTWQRPHDSQPALFGFAVRNILKTDPDFASLVFDAMEKNNNWWLTARMTSFGLVFCPSGLETGQDDSPRFDDGQTLATDMNSYLLDQLRTTADIAEMLGFEDKKEKWNKEADKLSENMIKYLYDEESNLFYDVLPGTNEKVKIVSLSSMLPVWAGVNLPVEKQKAMIENYLLNEEYMFGEIPFPSVAYNEEKYESDGWWRGPTWMPTSYLMLDLLRKFGYEKERKAASDRLIKILIKDGKMHELFDSKTGEGMGQLQQGWTSAIFINLVSNP